ncbi:MAG: phosphate ABC transporter permease PstA [Caldilineales bacterium]|nr:phosphate ABC transporter permease PstA [Caldilineales bacterium]MDW8319598.1 phosphate ABC transporter permease PstA [Anaerolineae bacterium]
MAVTNQGMPPGTFPEGDQYLDFVRRRRRVGTFFRTLFFLATVLGIVILATLLLDVTNDTFGYVAVQNQVDPETVIDRYYKERMLSMPRTVTSEDDVVLAEGVAVRANAIGFFGYAYYQERTDTLRALALDGVEPTAENAASGQYFLARPLYIYTSERLLRQRPEVAAFVDFFLQNAAEVAQEAGYITPGEQDLAEGRRLWQETTGLTASPAANTLPADSVIRAAGSSTVQPITARVAERFKAETGFAGEVVVEGGGTLAGFRRLCRDQDIQIANASRAMERPDVNTCRGNKVEPLAFDIGTDAISVVVSQQNDFLPAGLTREQLRKIFIEAERWSDVDPSWPNKPILRFIPGADSGTLDYFVSQVYGDSLDDLPREDLLAILETNISAGRLRALNAERPVEERSTEEIYDLVIAEVIKPRVVESWSFTESLFRRAEIEAAVAEIPNASMEFRRWLTWEFIRSPQSSVPTLAGIRTAIFGSLWVTLIAFLVAVPLGVAAATYLEEYSKGTRLDGIIETNINNLAGVPSIIYGMLGLAVFVRFFGQITSGLAFGIGDPSTANGRTILSAGLTLGLLILPLVIINAREAIRAVPRALREAAYGLGATKWQTVRSHVLPYALPGILTGVILSVSRAFGETAPLIVVGVSTFIVIDPSGPFSKFTTLPAQIYQWVSRPQEEFQRIAAAAILVLLTLLLLVNATAIYLRNRFSRRY